jgi:hypothetical protein
MIVSARSKKASMTVARRLVTAGEPVEGVLPGMGAFNVPTPTGLDRCFLTFVRDAAVQAAFVEQGAGLVGVIACVQVDGDVVG